MKMRLMTLSISGLALAGVVGVLGLASHTERSPHVPTKREILHKGEHPYGLDSKGGGQLDVSLTSSFATPIPAGKSFSLSASVTTKSALQDLHYEWILPEGVTIVSGAATGPLGDLVEGAVLETSIQLMSTSEDNKQIHLHVYRLVGGEASGQMTQFNTRDQSKIASDAALKAESFSGMGRAPASNPDKRIMQ